jgi:hypothetical protein
MHARDPELLARELPGRLRDSTLNVRFLALEVAENHKDRQLLDPVASDDPAAYVRGLAQRALGSLEEQLCVGSALPASAYAWFRSHELERLVLAVDPTSLEV